MSSRGDFNAEDASVRRSYDSRSTSSSVGWSSSIADRKPATAGRRAKTSSYIKDVVNARPVSARANPDRMHSANMTATETDRTASPIVPVPRISSAAETNGSNEVTTMVCGCLIRKRIDRKPDSQPTVVRLADKTYLPEIVGGRRLSLDCDTARLTTTGRYR